MILFPSTLECHRQIYKSLLFLEINLAINLVLTSALPHRSFDIQIARLDDNIGSAAICRVRCPILIRALPFDI